MCTNTATEDETQRPGQNEPWTQDCQWPSKPYS